MISAAPASVKRKWGGFAEVLLFIHKRKSRDFGALPVETRPDVCYNITLPG